MAAKRKILYLYLTLVCFIGIIAIFIVDGYLGVYDSVHITSGEYEQKIEADFWTRQDRYWSTGVNRGEKVFFRYEVDNRLFSQYTADVEVSVWHGQEKVSDLVSWQQLSIPPFDKAQLEWTVDTTEIIPGDLPYDQSIQYSVMITREETERKIIVDVNPGYPPIKALPVPRQ